MIIFKQIFANIYTIGDMVKDNVGLTKRKEGVLMAESLAGQKPH